MDRRRLLMLAPLGAVALGGGAFWMMLNRMSEGRFDPHDIGNPMLGKPLPAFALQPTAGSDGFSSADLRAAAARQPILLNFFASWCIPCAAEAPALQSLKDQGLPIWGVTAAAGAFKDAPAKTAAFLAQNGDPYTRLGTDPTGGLFIDMGLFGVPENFLIGRNGTVVWHLAGPLSGAIIQNQLLAALRSA